MGGRGIRRHRLLKAAEIAEAYLLRGVIIGLLLLVVAQSLLARDAGRTFAGYISRLEDGPPVESAPVIMRDPSGAVFLSPADSPIFTVTIALVSHRRAPGVRLLVNGVAVMEFTQPVVAIEVVPDDVLEIDGRGTDATYVFRVIDAEPDVAEPLEGSEVFVRNSRTPLASVKVGP